MGWVREFIDELAHQEIVVLISSGADKHPSLFKGWILVFVFVSGTYCLWADKSEK